MKAFIPNQQIGYILLSQTSSNFADSILRLLLIIMVTELSQSPWAISGIVLVETVPFVLLASFFGVLIDKYNQNKILMYSEISRALLIFSLFFFTDFLLIIYFFALVDTIITVIANPTRSTLIGKYANESQYTPILSLSQNIVQISMLLGVGLAGVLIATIGIRFTVLVVAVLYLVSFISAILLNISAKTSMAQRTNAEEIGSFSEAFKVGIHSVTKNKTLLTLISIFSLAIAGFSFFNILAIDYVRNGLHYDAAKLGILETATGIGMIITTLAVGLFSKKLNLFRLFTTGIIGVGMVFISLIFYPTFIYLYLILLIMGISNGLLQVSYSSILMHESNDSNRGRIFTLVNSINNVTVFVGIILAAPLSNQFGPNMTLFAVGIFIVFIGVVGRISFTRIQKSVKEEPEELVESV